MKPIPTFLEWLATETGITWRDVPPKNPTSSRLSEKEANALKQKLPADWQPELQASPTTPNSVRLCLKSDKPQKNYLDAYKKFAPNACEILMQVLRDLTKVDPNIVIEQANNKVTIDFPQTKNQFKQTYDDQAVLFWSIYETFLNLGFVYKQKPNHCFLSLEIEDIYNLPLILATDFPQKFRQTFEQRKESLLFSRNENAVKNLYIKKVFNELDDWNYKCDSVSPVRALVNQIKRELVNIDFELILDSEKEAKTDAYIIKLTQDNELFRTSSVLNHILEKHNGGQKLKATEDFTATSVRASSSGYSFLESTANNPSDDLVFQLDSKP